MNAKERELLTGMVNCYNTCHEDFEGTVRMVASARKLKPEKVKSMLSRIALKYGSSDEYAALRKKLPKEFPLII
ncbi:MAG: hypothetical protein QXR58_00190 [Candidatus Micrarchaeaceae archaeon]